MTDINKFNISRLSALLHSADRIAIISHMKPDGDALGSSLAMHHFLQERGKDSTIVFPDPYPAYLSFLAEGEKIISYENEPEESERVINGCDLIICLDFNAFHRAGKLEELLDSSTAEKVLIDHHLNPAREQFSLSFSETEISSASELLFWILMEMPEVSNKAGNLPQKSLEALMTGLTTDTNNFGNSVFPSTLKMASEMLQAGVDRDGILVHIYNEFSENRLRLMGHMMKDLLKITGDGVAYIVLDAKTQEEYNIAEGETEGFVNMPLSIAKVRMSLLLKEDKDRVRVSIRSKKGTSANRCANLHFNGGGHENAAGGKLFIPADIADINEAASYIESHTHIFLTEENDK